MRNGAKYIAATIQSVLSQAYPNLEYVVVDGASTDGTQQIIQKYEAHLAWWVSQEDNGLYDALNTGFARSTGEVMGWLNASDLLHPGALAVVGSVFRTLPEVHWITGRPTHIGDDGSTAWIGAIPRWSRKRYIAGANRYIQQESTYWRRELWEKAGGNVDATRRDASDAELWLRFFRHAQLYSVDSMIGGYRKHADSIVALDAAGYDRSLDEIIAREAASLKGAPLLHAFRFLDATARRIPKFRDYWQRVVLSAVYARRGRDWPPVIKSDGTNWYLSD